MKPDEVIRQVADICRAHRAKKVILYGSRAKGTANKHSDIDIAVAEARQRDFTDSFVLSGTSEKFSITFDLSWKVMKDILVQHYAITGFVTGSPKEVLRESFKANLISDDAWMDMLKVRNELAHDYDCEIVKTHCNTIVKKYIDLFYEFEAVVKALL